MSSSITLAKPIALLFLASATLAQITRSPPITSLDFNVVTAWAEDVVDTETNICNNICPKGIGAVPIHKYCYAGTYNEEQQKLWAACYNTAKDVDGNLQLATLPAAYPDDAFKFLAYYAIADSLRYCADPKTVSSQADKNLPRPHPPPGLG